MSGLPVLWLLARDEAGTLQRVLGVLTRRRVRVERMLAEPDATGACLRLVLQSPQPHLAASVESLRRLHNVVEVRVASSWDEAQATVEVAA